MTDRQASDTQSAELLNELIECTRDGERFFLDAAEHVGDRVAKGVFRQMADVHQRLIDALGDHVLARGAAPAPGRTLAGGARQLYARALASLRDDAPVYVAQLEEAEDRLLERYRSALERSPNERVRGILERHLPTVQAAHLRMTRLKDLYRDPRRSAP
jgi:uncharacterized protein (TIGR02284 family)